MVGELYGTFCERSIGNALRAFELWAFPDSTLNLVVVSEGPAGKHEASFPCAIHHLQEVLSGRKVRFVRGLSTLKLAKSDDHVALHATCEDHEWRQSIEADSLQEALDRACESTLFLD